MVLAILIPILLIVVIIIIVPIIIVQSKKADTNNICKNGKRITDCLKVYKNPEYKVSFSKLNRNNILSYGPDQYYRLKDFYISSSYLSAHPCGHTKDLVSYENIKQVLNKGARFLYFDIYFKPSDIFNQNYYASNSKIVVQSVLDGERNALTTCGPNNQYLDIKKVMEVIRDNAWTGKEDYPLLVYLNLQLPKNIQAFEYNIFDAINKTLSDRLPNPVYSFQNRSIADAPLKDLLGKVVFLTNRKPINANLNEFINGVISPKTSNMIRYNMDKKIIDSGGVANLFVDKNDGIEKCKNSIYMVTTKSTPNDRNLYTPKMDLLNEDPTDAFEFGIQIFCMNFQDYNQDMKTYLNTELNPSEFKGKTFANSGFIRKPANLISLPRPPQPVYKQNRNVGLTSAAVVSSAGYADPIWGGNTNMAGAQG